MESVAAMLMLVFQLFFGWCGAPQPDSPAPACDEAAGDC
jgi:hypothetical protein